ncbi:hypothetical protein AcV5_010442 [Taiwanofungus camphoratus]|nr:hypothetical protein AcV5_010442 [Antrodia cinnamomea]
MGESGHSICCEAGGVPNGGAKAPSEKSGSHDSTSGPRGVGGTEPEPVCNALPAWAKGMETARLHQNPREMVALVFLPSHSGQHRQGQSDLPQVILVRIQSSTQIICPQIETSISCDKASSSHCDSRIRWQHKGTTSLIISCLRAKRTRT